MTTISVKPALLEQTLKTITLSTVLSAIKNGMVAQQIEQLRTLKSQHDDESQQQAKVVKDALPCFYCTHFHDETAGAGKRQPNTHSGIMVYDVDKISIEKANEYKHTVINSKLKPYIRAVFISPSGGLKILIDTTYNQYHDNTDESAEFYSYAYKKICSVLIAAGIDSEDADRSTCNFNRTTYLSHDPDLYENQEAKKLTINKTHTEWHTQHEQAKQERAEREELSRIKRQHMNYDEDAARSDLDRYMSKKAGEMRSGNRHGFYFPLVSFVHSIGLSEADAVRALYRWKVEGHYTDTQSVDNFVRDAWTTVSKNEQRLAERYYRFDINDHVGRKTALKDIFRALNERDTQL